jgi:hypothetical protein
MERKDTIMRLQEGSPMTVTAQLAVTSQWGTLQDIQGESISNRQKCLLRNVQPEVGVHPA